MNEQNTWLEPMLARHLGPATAPEGLWERIVEPRPQPSGISTSRLVLAFAAVLVAAVLLWGFHPGRATNQMVEFRSGELAEVRSWVRTNTGLEVPLHSVPSARLIGASVLKSGEASARIVYRVDGSDLTLLVADAGSAPIPTGSALSWTAQGQRYTVECDNPEGLKIGCQLCHTGV